MHQNVQRGPTWAAFCGFWCEASEGAPRLAPSSPALAGRQRLSAKRRCPNPWADDHFPTPRRLGPTKLGGGGLERERREGGLVSSRDTGKG